MNPRLQAIGDVLLGTERRLRVRSARCLLACGLMAYSVASLGYFVAVGLAAWAPVLALSLFGLGGMLVFYAAIRSRASERCRDPSLTVAQMSFALLVGAIAYTLAGRGRGAVFPIMMVVLMFGLYSLSPMQVRLMSWLALLLFGGAMALMVWRNPRIYRPEVEFAHFLVIAIFLPAVSMLAGQLGRLRDTLKRQRSDLREALARNEELAQRDELTGLANRRHMTALLELERERSEARGERFCLAVLDIDRFKRINDTHGHPTGDQVLKAFAMEALDAIREADVLARWGGEEFMLMLPSTGLTAARLGLERLRTRVEALRVAHEGRELSFTLSAGLAEHLPGEALAEAISRADRALYQAKQQGRNKVVAG
jgi:diguanylate cyclase (GGDEF)-like protein